jgi:Asp-tRNA(Asn)/Glu-tRNA(Gln) amidotransferase A subunit family amidase
MIRLGCSFLAPNQFGQNVEPSKASTVAVGSLCPYTGYPIGVVPPGNLTQTNQPYGLCIVAHAHREAQIFHFMSASEASFPKRPSPPMLS